MMEKEKEQVVTEIATTGEFDAPYQDVLGDVSKIIDEARESAARLVKAAYRLVECSSTYGWNVSCAQ